VDETQQLALLFREHLGLQITALIRHRSTIGRIKILAKTNREQTLVVHALFGKWKSRNLWVWLETGAKPAWLVVAEVSATMAKRFSPAS